MLLTECILPRTAGCSFLASPSGSSIHYQYQQSVQLYGGARGLGYLVTRRLKVANDRRREPISRRCSQESWKSILTIHLVSDMQALVAHGAGAHHANWITHDCRSTSRREANHLPSGASRSACTDTGGG